MERTPRTIYIVQRENFDGLYAFENAQQADMYADLFDGVYAGTVDVLDVEAAARLIRAERTEQGHR